MADILTASPTNDIPGVVKTPPDQIRGAIRAAVAECLATIPPGKSGVVEVGVSLEHGVNLVYAHKVNDRWTAFSWVGRNWSGEITGGAQITASW